MLHDHDDRFDYVDAPAPEIESMEGVALHVGRSCHWRTCPTCDGAGELTANTSHNGDPQCDEPVPCPDPECVDGTIEEWVDPLLRLRTARRTLLRFRASPYANVCYGEARQLAVSPEYLPGGAL